MKFTKTFAAAALFLLGAANAFSQSDKGYVVQPMADEVAKLANQIVENQFTDVEKANKLYKQLSSKIKKNNDQLISVGNFFLDNKIVQLANFMSKQVYQNDATYIPGLFFGGEVAMARKDYGTAGQKYEEILNIQPDNITAMHLNAFVYKNVNPHVAIDMYNKIKELQPENYEADRELADVYYNMNDFEEAAKYYADYFKRVPKGQEYEGAAENYVSSLHMIHNIEALSENAKKFSNLYAKSPVFKRMIFFADVESYDVDAADASVAYLSDPTYVDTVFTYLDYEYAAQYAADMKSDAALAVDYMKKAVAKDETKIEGLSKLATYQRGNGQYADAIDTFTKYMDKKGKDVNMADTFKLAMCYLYAAQDNNAEPAAKEAYIAKGSELFKAVEEAQPDNYQPTFYRARLVTTDGFEEETRQIYDLVLQKLTDEDPESIRLQADWYNVVYYINTANENPAILVKARKYVDDMLSVDDENVNALNADTYLKNFKL